MAAVLLLSNVLLPVTPAFADHQPNHGQSGGGQGGSGQTGTAQPVWCQRVGTDYEFTAQLGNSNSGGNNPNRFPLMELPSGYENDIYIDESSGQVYAYNSSDDTLKGALDAACTQQYVIPVPAEPGVNVLCGPNNDTWMVPVSDSVFQWSALNGRLIVEIVADGYIFTDGSTIYDYGVVTDDATAGCELVYIPVSLGVEDPCGLDNAVLLTDEIESLANISVEINPNGSVSVTADDGYRLTVNGETTFVTYTYDAPVDSENLCEISSQKPKFVDKCGTVNDYFVVKDTEYVEYYNGNELLVAGQKYYVTDASEVAITAKVTDENYEIVNTTEYTKQFTDKACRAKVGLEAMAFCEALDTRIKAAVTNTTKSWQSYEVVVTNSEGVEVATEVVDVAKGETLDVDLVVDGDGEFTASVYSYNKEKRGKLLAEQAVTTECEDTFTPEIYKRNQNGAILSTGTFTVEVCQGYGEARVALVAAEYNCETYNDVMFGTDGTWFANYVNFEGYEINKPTTVTITETVAPVGCTPALAPWVFVWDYNYDQVNVLADYRVSGSWNTVDGSNVFNLVNNCDEPGRGGHTPTPTPTITTTITPAETLAETGASTNGILAIAGAMLLASVGLALSPRFRHGEV